jgi:hypothetical protein
MYLYSQLIQAETGDVIKQSARCNQVVTPKDAAMSFAVSVSVTAHNKDGVDPQTCQVSAHNQCK